MFCSDPKGWNVWGSLPPYRPDRVAMWTMLCVFVSRVGGASCGAVVVTLLRLCVTWPLQAPAPRGVILWISGVTRDRAGQEPARPGSRNPVDDIIRTKNVYVFV